MALKSLKGKCRPGIEHVQLTCSGELIEVEFNDILFGDSMAITVNKYGSLYTVVYLLLNSCFTGIYSCTTGYGIKMNYNARTVRIDPQVCDSHIHFEDDEVTFRHNM